MSRHLHTLAIVLLTAVAIAQQSTPASDPASPHAAQPAAGLASGSASISSPTPAASATSVSAGTLADGTPMKLRLLKQIDSKSAKNGDQIAFAVENDVVVNGVTVLRRGSPVTAVVSQAVSSKTMGRAGRLTFTVNDIELLNGIKVPVRAFNRTSGENRTGEMISYMLNAPIAAAPFFLLMHGGETVFPKGTEINAFVNGDLLLDPTSFLPAHRDSSDDPGKVEIAPLVSAPRKETSAPPTGVSKKDEPE
ncbi:MAG: hypothetical protein WAM71_11930 [Candidatus Korobacteraceae bacterium]